MTDPARFFQNRACPHFPCHEGIAAERFSCLFCFCPLYALGRACGGACSYTAQGIKDCSPCTFPHEADNYDAILARCGEIMDVARREDGR